MAPKQVPAWLRDELRDCIETLASIERPSASEGERQAAEWIASRLRDLGLQPQIEAEPAHGGYWWPLGLLNVLSAIAAIFALRGGRARRLLAALIGAFCAKAVWDEVGGLNMWFRRLLPSRRTFNVLASAGDLSAKETLLIIAHHDAAHSGLVFHPALPRLAMRAFPKLHARSKQSAPIMFATWLGPALASIGGLLGCKRALRLAGLFGVGASAAMADIGLADTVPGANDNLTAVAVMLATAHRLRERPVDGLRVLLLSTGSEESFMEGMHGFMRRHGGELDLASTQVLCLECLGGPTLTLLEGEGMLRMRSYSPQMRRALAEAASAAGVPLAQDLRTVAATDALVALRRGFVAATLASVDETKFPSNYHWASDTPENVVWETVEAAFTMVQQFVEDQADSARGARDSSLSGLEA